MPQLPVISGKARMKFLLAIGFVIVRVKGSHHRLKHPDGRVTAILVHKSQDLRKGLLRKIICGDLELESDSFIDLWKNHN